MYYTSMLTILVVCCHTKYHPDCFILVALCVLFFTIAHSDFDQHINIPFVNTF